MCKTPACECPKAEGNNYVDMEGDSDVSEIENEPMDSDDYNSVDSATSCDEAASDSDADSASGNRVTADMVVWLMLKEEGIITQEKYAEKAEQCEDNIKSFIPKIPRSCSSESSDDNTETLNNDESLLHTFFEVIRKNKEKSDAENPNGNAESQENEETLKDVNYGVCNLLKETKNASGDNATADKSTVEGIITSTSPQEHAPVEHGGTESNDFSKIFTDIKERAITLMQELETSKDINPKISNKDEQVASSEQVTNENNTEAMPGSQKQGKDSTDNENNKDQLNENGTLPEEKDEKLAEVNDQDTKQAVPPAKAEGGVKTANLITENRTSQATNKKTESFNYILEHIVKEKLISKEYEYVDVLETYVKDLDAHYKNNKAVDIFDKPTRNLREFAFFLNFYSPSSYKYIVENFHTPLPEHKVLCSWYLKGDGRPGLTGRAFKILKQKASTKRLTCVLMSRDIFIKNYGLDYDQVDYGGGCNLEYTDKAIITLVFVLVSLDEDWKIPVGYIFAKQVPAESQAELIRVCLTQCHEAGADVVAVTLDTPTPAEFLGCSFQDPKNLKTVFKHPVCDRDVAVWIDPCLALRSARHTLKAKSVLQDDQGNKIRWSLIRKLKNLYSNETMKFEQAKFLQLRNHIAKVGLTTEIFSDSLSPALELCEELMPDSFKDTAATRRYIEIVNTIYDILHSKITTGLGKVTEQLNMAKDYMLALLCNEGNALSPFDEENLARDKRLIFRPFLDGKPACGFIGFLICIESFKHLHATLIEKEKRMDHLNPHRLCKDHAEDFVKNLRAYDGRHPEDFNGWNFSCYYDYLFDNLERNPGYSDKNIELEHWAMKNKYTPAVTIKLTSGKRAYDEVYSFQYAPKKLKNTTHVDRATKLVRAYSKAMDTEADSSTRKNMVGYLAGWIAARFAKCLKCEACIDALCADKKHWFHKFITSTDIKGICLPNEELFRICWECERALRTTRSPARLRARALRRLAAAAAARFPWSSRAARHPPAHHVHLARAVLAKYIPLRIAAPFSSKEQKRIAGMFNLFKCMSRVGLFAKLNGIESSDEED